VESDAELVAALRAGIADARAIMFNRFAKRIARLIFNVLGPEPEAEDILHEVFVRALERLHSLDSPERFGGWLSGVAVLTSREWIRKRARWRWFSALTDDVDAEAPHASDEVTEALRAAFEVLRNMPTDERVIYALRNIDGMELEEIAVALDSSLSTTKRRLKDAQKRFSTLAQKKPALLPWLERQTDRARLKVVTS
jgi:RNA polymerase sigma-70 factor (ECF subfamily)